jgi:hypothetical protein
MGPKGRVKKGVSVKSYVLGFQIVCPTPLSFNQNWLPNLDLNTISIVNGW